MDIVVDNSIVDSFVYTSDNDNKGGVDGKIKEKRNKMVNDGPDKMEGFKDDDGIIQESNLLIEDPWSCDFEGKEMEKGKGFALEIYRNKSEELLLKSLMDSSIGMLVPTMEMLDPKNISASYHHNFHTDSEELFKNWRPNREASKKPTISSSSSFS